MAEALATISQVDDLGMIQIRADLARAGDAIAGAAGLAIPAQGAASPMARAVWAGCRPMNCC